MPCFQATPHLRLAASAVAAQLAVALREQANAADRVAKLAQSDLGGDGGYPAELPYFDRLAHECGTLRSALHVLRTGPSKTIDTAIVINGTKPSAPSPEQPREAE